MRRKQFTPEKAYRVAQEIAEFYKLRKRGRGWRWRGKCPVHGGHDKSFELFAPEAADLPLVFCFAGCGYAAYDQVVADTGLLPKRGARV